MNDKEFFEERASKVDELTGVYTRDVVIDYIEKLLSENRPFSVALLDVDNFKYINDGYGHLFGDHVLKQLGKALNNDISKYGVLGRYGGDEFIFVLDGVTDYSEAWERYHDVLSVTKRFDDPKLNDMNLTVTIGSARFPKDATAIDGLFELADKALYRGKMKGRNCFIIYLAEKHAHINLKTERDKIVSSMYLHAKVYNSLTKNANFAKGLTETINYLGNYFMIDHLCITDNVAMYFDYYHPICKKRDFVLLLDDEMRETINPTTGICYKNTITAENSSSDVTHKADKKLIENGVYSCFFCEIIAFGKHFGYVRADISDNSRGRVWQNIDMDVLQNLAHIIALNLYYRNMEIKDIK